MKDKRAWKVIPITVIVAVRLAETIAAGGNGVVYWLNVVGGNIMLAIGWAGGWLLADLDKYLGKYGDKLGNGKKIIEQWSTGVRNVLTAAALMVAGIWVISSSRSLVAGGLVLGLEVKLFEEMLREPDYKKWFWVFTRSFGEGERRLFLLIWAVVMIVQAILLIRG